MNDDERKENIAKRARRILDIAGNMATGMGYQVTNRIEEFRLHYEGYAEPGYSSDTGLVAMGNWNSIDQYDPNTKCRTIISDLPKRVCDLFEKMGIDCEWNDEWYECSCGKLVRSNADSYSWTPSYQYYDGEISCIDCLLEDPEGYLFSLEGNSECANTISEIDPGDHGYVIVNDESYETGWHPGQNDSPTKIASELESKGIYRYVFDIDSVGQFDSHWSVYVHMDEEHLLNKLDEDIDMEDECEDCSHCSKGECDNPPITMRSEDLIIENKNDYPCKCCGTGLNAGESPCWKCGTSNPTY